MRSLTEKQKSVLDFIEREIRLRRQPPTIKEVARHIGSDNTRSGLTHIEALIRKGYLERRPGQARSLRLTGTGMALYDYRDPDRLEIPLLVDRILRPDAPDTFPTPASFFPTPPDYALFVGPGRELTEAGILEGDILFVQRTLSLISSGIVIFRESASGELFPGVLARMRERLILRSPSLESSEKEIRKSEIATVLQGRVVALFRSFEPTEDSKPTRTFSKES